MADWAKIIVKSALIAVVMVALWAVFTQIQIPAIDYQDATMFFSKAYTIITYWLPIFPTLWNTTLILLGVLIGLWTFRFAMVATRWLFKVNE